MQYHFTLGPAPEAKPFISFYHLTARKAECIPSSVEERTCPQKQGPAGSLFLCSASGFASPPSPSFFVFSQDQSQWNPSEKSGEWVILVMYPLTSLR
jgi:hypothetical protein